MNFYLSVMAEQALKELIKEGLRSKTQNNDQYYLALLLRQVAKQERASQQLPLLAKLNSIKQLPRHVSH